MKTIGVVLILMLLVAGVAVGGSRAQTLPATSVAFEQCQGGGGALRGQCRPLVTAVAMMAEEGPGGDRGLGAVGANEAGADIGPERSWQEHAVQVLLALAEAMLREANNHFLGNGLPIMLDSPIASSLFDPAR